MFRKTLGVPKGRRPKNVSLGAPKRPLGPPLGHLGPLCPYRDRPYRDGPYRDGPDGGGKRLSRNTCAGNKFVIYKPSWKQTVAETRS